MSITTTSNLGPLILQSIAPAILYVPTPQENYILVADKQSLPRNGGSQLRFMKPRALQPATTQLGNSGIDPAAQLPQRDVIDINTSYYGTGCYINRVFVDVKPMVIDLETLAA